MKINIYLFNLIIFACLSATCQHSKEEVIQLKNRCYSKKLIEYKKTKAYNEIFVKFQDTIQTLFKNVRYFGDTNQVLNAVDDAIFFDRKEQYCLLIVLQKERSNPIVFGSARIMIGKMENNVWEFSVGLTYDFDKDYFSTYPDNSFENISQLARYAVLTEGNIRTIKGCEIDEAFWFDELLR